MKTMIESRQGDFTHSSSIMMWILAACAGTYSVRDAWHKLTRVDHCAQYSFFLARELFTISFIVGAVRRHPSQLWRITVSTRPPRVSPTLPQGVISGCVNACRGRIHPACHHPHPHPRFQQRRSWLAGVADGAGEGRTVWDKDYSDMMRRPLMRRADPLSFCML